MLLLMCQAGPHRYAIDSRYAREVLPRVNLRRSSGDPPWLAGMLIHRGNAIPVVDLTQLTECMDCPNRYSNRIVVVETERKRQRLPIGILAEQVDLSEIHGDRPQTVRSNPGANLFGDLCLDDRGVFQQFSVPHLASADRLAGLFPDTETDR